jgi:hypothetical protein
MNVVFSLALVTLLLVLAYLCWDLYSLLKNPRHGIGVYGLGINDPTPLERSPEAMRRALDEADSDV